MLPGVRSTADAIVVAVAWIVETASLANGCESATRLRVGPRVPETSPDIRAGDTAWPLLALIGSPVGSVRPTLGQGRTLAIFDFS